MHASPTNTVDVSKLMQLKADAVSHRERLGSVDISQFTTVAELATFVLGELGFNLAPMFESAVDAIHEDVMGRVEDLEEAVEEIIEETGDQLTEETSSQILSVFQQGRAICNALESLAKNLDAVTRTRLGKAIKVYRTSETAVREVVQAITMPAEDEEVGGGTTPGEDPAEGEGVRIPDDEVPAAAAPGEEG